MPVSTATSSTVAPRDSLRLFRRLALVGALLAACAVVLGAWVRLTDAGLGCPDWPGCYGHAFPQGAPHAARAWHEMVHRYVAGTLATTIAALTVWAFVARRRPGQPVAPVIALWVIVCAQATLGALTVTWLLNPWIVTAHLLGGLTTLALLWWLSLSTPHTPLAPQERALRPFALIALAVLILQVALGGWTSSNYAAIACPDFPTCQRAWWPDPDFRGALTVWHQGLDYQGGVLDNHARIAVHLAHRIGALVTGVTLLGLAFTARARARSARVARAATWVLIAVCLQIGLGISVVHFGVPLPLATLHNAGAAFLVLGFVTLLRSLWPRAPAADAVRAYGSHRSPMVGFARVDAS
jgi:cytochrome c oxidase assembly protein subunit 15